MSRGHSVVWAEMVPVLRLKVRLKHRFSHRQPYSLTSRRLSECYRRISFNVPNLTGCVIVSMDLGLPYPEDEGNAIFRNVGNYSPNGTASRPARLESSTTLL